MLKAHAVLMVAVVGLQTLLLDRHEDFVVFNNRLVIQMYQQQVKMLKSWTKGFQSMFHSLPVVRICRIWTLYSSSGIQQQVSRDCTRLMSLILHLKMADVEFVCRFGMTILHDDRNLSFLPAWICTWLVIGWRANCVQFQGACRSVSALLAVALVHDPDSSAISHNLPLLHLFYEVKRPNTCRHG